MPPARGARSRPTMNDVAALAGVALKTVSRVVNDERNVSVEKAERVRAAIQELGFVRNNGARMLKQGSAATVGLIVDSMADPFNAEIAVALEAAAFERGSLLFTASSNRDPDRFRNLATALASQRAGGLVMAPPEGDCSFLEREQSAGTRMVFIDRPPENVLAHVVLADNRGGARAAVAHLLEHGHRRIACLAHTTSPYTSGERIEGYRMALRERGAPIDETLILTPAPDVDGVSAALRRLGEMEDPPTAVFTTNNRLTSLFLSARSHSPAPLAIVGFDDLELAGAVSPPVTVVAQDPARIGTTAASLLLDPPTAARTVVIPTRLIVRASGGEPGR